ncbi:MAG TPA: hypothetical protein VJ865_11290 [Gemmatimonadaceae bacterium]|nr:hypothetical protein [Gemmatimonadaceae bacterium]
MVFGKVTRRLTLQRSAVLFGLAVGAAFGLWNLITTWTDPLAEDTPSALLIFYGPMFATWALAGLAAARRTGRVLDGIKVGAMVAFVTFVVYDVTQFIRVNLFLDTLTQRSDWQNMMGSFKNSGSQNLRSYVNYVGLKGAPFKGLVASLIGATTGLIGGSLGKLSHHSPSTAT